MFGVESRTSRFGGAMHFWALLARRVRKMTPDELKFSSVRLLLEGVKSRYRFFSMIFGQKWPSLVLMFCWEHKDCSVGNTRNSCVWNTMNFLCLKHKKLLSCLKHNELLLLGTQRISFAWNTMNLLCLKHKESLLLGTQWISLAWDTMNFCVWNTRKKSTSTNFAMCPGTWYYREGE